MYASSSAYKTAIAAAARTTRITGVLTLAGGSTVNLTNADIVQGTLTMSEQCVSGDALEIGNVYASELNVGLVTPASNITSVSACTLSWRDVVRTTFDAVASTFQLLWSRGAADWPTAPEK